MVLDTGASLTMLPHEVILAIGCDPTKTARHVEIMTASSVEVVPVVVVPAVTALGNAVKHLEAICHSLPSISPVEGLLGLNFLRHFDLHMNFRSTKTLELRR